MSFILKDKYWTVKGEIVHWLEFALKYYAKNKSE